MEPGSTSSPSGPVPGQAVDRPAQGSAATQGARRSRPGYRGSWLPVSSSRPSGSPRPPRGLGAGTGVSSPEAWERESPQLATSGPACGLARGRGPSETQTSSTASALLVRPFQPSPERAAGCVSLREQPGPAPQPPCCPPPSLWGPCPLSRAPATFCSPEAKHTGHGERGEALLGLHSGQ